MTATNLDISAVLTGGSGNINPNLSIGGSPSSQPIIGTLNNLFSDVTQIEAQTGVIDYRCIYIFNNSSVNSLYNLNLYATNIFGTESEIQIGTLFATEVQNITIIGNATDGSFDISYKPPTQSIIETRTVAYNYDPATWAINLQNQLNSIPTFSGIVVSVSGNFGSRIFNILFAGSDDLRSHDLIGLDVSGLTGGTITGSVSKSVTGAPINSLPVLLDSPTTPPTDVAFLTTSPLSVLQIGNLYPEEGFPLWIQRSVSPGETPVAGEGIILSITADPI